jgi:2'-5' RNA ligase
MRLFAGIAIAGHVLDSLARTLKQLRPLAPLHWSPVENLHITSKFIGEWPEARLDQLESVLEDVKTPGVFDISVSGFGYFPNPHNPRTLFAAVHSDPALAELAGGIDESFRPLGVAHEERPYSPHLTLAKIKHENIRDLREHIATMPNFDFGTFRVTEFHLFLSKLGPKGSVYSSLATYPLAAASSQTGRPQ